MRSKLLAIPPEHVAPKKPKVLIFGRPGVGKTWTSVDFPGCYLIDTEGGADMDHYREKLRVGGGAYLGPEQGSLEFDVVIDQMKALAVERHPYRTVVIDSISKLWNTALTDEQERLGSKDAFGAFKKLPTRQFGSLIKWVNRLDMTVVFIAHEKDVWGMNDQKQREVVGYGPDCQDKLEYDLHLVLRIIKAGNSRYAKVGKSRLPAFVENDTFTWSYPEFAQRYGADIMDAEAQPIEIITPGQLKEIEELLGVIRMPDGWEDKVLKAAQADEWKEIDTKQAAACIGLMRKRIENKTEGQLT